MYYGREEERIKVTMLIEKTAVEGELRYIRTFAHNLGIDGDDSTIAPGQARLRTRHEGPRSCKS